MRVGSLGIGAMGPLPKLHILNLKFCEMSLVALKNRATFSLWHRKTGNPKDYFLDTIHRRFATDTSKQYLAIRYGMSTAQDF